MPPVLVTKHSTVLDRAKFTVTGYLCQDCWHWNDLKRRKAKEHSSANPVQSP
jgi:hypothetical protein